MNNRRPSPSFDIHEDIAVFENFVDAEEYAALCRFHGQSSACVEPVSDIVFADDPRPAVRVAPATRAAIAKALNIPEHVTQKIRAFLIAQFQAVHRSMQLAAHRNEHRCIRRFD